MEARRKQEIRSLIHTIPSLVKAHLVNQAFETETIIASTFELSDEFQSLMSNIPQNYIEKVSDWYSKLAFKAFQGGINNAKLKLQTVDMKAPEGDERDEEIKVKIPMPYSLSQNLARTFQENVGTMLQTVPDSAEIFVQFKQDLENAYRDGVNEELKMRDEEQADEEVEEEIEEIEVAEEVGEDYEEDYEEDDEAAMETEEEIDEGAFLEELLDEIESEPTIDRHENIDKPVGGNDTMDEKTLASKLGKDPILADVSPNEIIRALEEYTRIPGDSMAEEVLRYTLGLPPRGKPATASIRKTVRGGNVIGPYDTQALRQKVLSAVKTHVIDDNELQTVVIDSIVSGISDLSSDEAAQAIARKMGFTEALASGEVSLEDVKSRSDVLAQKLTNSLGLPGDMVFIDVDGDYLLTFAFHRSDVDELGQEAGTTSEASKKIRAAKSAKRRPLAPAPQGVLSKMDQSQISSLAGLSRSRTMRDVRKASPKVAAYLNDVLKNIRTGRIGLAEGSSKLRAQLSDVIAEVFGMDGLGYYEFLRDRKKRA